jgi:hypothetical protein
LWHTDANTVYNTDANAVTDEDTDSDADTDTERIPDAESVAVMFAGRYSGSVDNSGAGNH